MSILSSVVGRITTSLKRSTISAKDLINLESRIGGKLFGPVPEGHKREFFCLDKHTWVWHEEITNLYTNTTTSLTTRYEVRDSRIIKIQDGQPPRHASLAETKNLHEATRQYYTQVASQIYNKQVA